MEFLRARGGAADPPRSSDSSGAWSGTGAAVEGESNSWDVERPSGLDAFLVPPPRRHGGQIAIGIVFGLVVVGVGAYLYYRFGRTAEEPGDAAGRGPHAVPVAVAVAEVVQGPVDAGLTLPPALAAIGGASVADAALPSVVGTATSERQDTGLEIAEPDGTGAASEVDALPSPAAALACGDALGEARDLWRKRDRAGALQKLRDAFACDPAAGEPRLQWGQWVTDTPALYGDRAVCAEGAAALRPAAEANPNGGELWFHYTNLLYGAGEREAAQAAKEHCMGIRPRDEYSGTCRFLPQ